MVISEVRVTLAQTVGMPNYGSARIEVSVAATVGAGESPNAVYGKLLTWTKEKIAAQVSEVEATR